MEKGKEISEKCRLCRLCGIFCCIVFLVLAMMAMTITKLILGVIYINDCSLQPLLPIWLIVSACVSILLASLVSRLTKLPKHDVHDENHESVEEVITCSKCVYCIVGIGMLFNLAWLIAGTYWLSTVWATVKYNACGTGNCCNIILTDFSMAVAILDWILIGISINQVICSKNYDDNDSESSKDNQSTITT